MEKKRCILFFVLFLLLISVLSLRLAYIQIIGHEELSEAALRQQRIRIEGADGRGIIYDRNKVPMTGTNKDYVYIIDRETVETNDDARIAALGARKISNYSKQYNVYTFSTFNAAADRILRNEYNAFVMEAERRYDNQQPAAHILGYVRELDGSGASGVELAYNEVLSERRRTLYAFADAKGKIIPGIGLSSNIENGDTGIVTTLEICLQEEVERILNESERNGAVVIVQSKTGQVLAAGSTPSFNPNRIKEYIDSDNGELLNKVIQGEYPPGSVFKIIVAAAALENKIKDKEGNPVDLNTKFVCKGSEELYGTTIKCSTGGESGHGEIRLKDAFAKSCNSAFIQLGQLVSGEKILEMSKDFGLSETGITDLMNVKAGHLTKEEDTRGTGIGNLSIGQGDLLVTPIQMARMTNIIANRGMDVGICVLSDTHNTQKRVISDDTAKLIQEMMVATMTYGTGNNIITSETVAGKTGSAEASISGESVVHGWFTGFFPASDPEYTVTVFIEKGRSGRASALPIFDEIEEFINGKQNT